MVKVFFFLFLYCSIPNADRFLQINIKLSLYRLCICFDKCITKCIQFHFIFSCLIMKPLLYLFNKYFSYFLIRYDQLVYAFFCFSAFRQIPGSKKYAPNMIHTSVQITICQFLSDLFSYAFPADQLLNFPAGILTGHLQEFSDNFIAACIHPESLRFCVRFGHQQINIINHIPWTVYICISNTITIIPFFHFPVCILYPIEFKNRSHFLVCEAKVFMEPDICNREYFKIIQACKNTFFCNPQTSC